MITQMSDLKKIAFFKMKLSLLLTTDISQFHKVLLIQSEQV